MTQKIRRTIASANSGYSLRLIENEDGNVVVSTLDEFGYIKSSILVKKQHLFPEIGVAYDQFEFPSTPGTKFNALVEDDDDEARVFTTFTDGQGTTFYRLEDTDSFYTEEELECYDRFSIVDAE